MILEMLRSLNSLVAKNDPTIDIIIPRINVTKNIAVGNTNLKGNSVNMSI